MRVEPEKIVIFATGVELQAVECVVEGIRQWRWVAINFERDSYLDEELILPTEQADKQAELYKVVDNE